MQANYVQRLRLEFAKTGPTRFIGHLDLAKALERSLNRAQISLAYTQGYNPRPRMQLAAALPLGFTSECELADIWLLETVDALATGPTIASNMAPGIELKRITEVSLGEAALQNQLSEAVYLASVVEAVDPKLIASAIAGFMSSESIVKKRRGKEYDLRPLVKELSVGDDETSGKEQNKSSREWLTIKMRLSMLPGKTGRPDEVLEVIGIDPSAARIHRQRLILSND